MEGRGGRGLGRGEGREGEARGAEGARGGVYGLRHVKVPKDRFVFKIADV